MTTAMAQPGALGSMPSALPVMGGTPITPVSVVSGTPAVSGPTLAASDLAEILSRFNEASVALQRTHETLQAEVTRLTRELEDANEELQRSRRLAALGEMAAGIAHEVRNPLASIGLDARMIEAEAAEKPEARSAAERIGIAVRGLDRVVGDVLCFAREMRPRVEAVPAEELLERAQAECGPLACTAGVDLLVRECAGVDVRCDAELAHRALTNLVRNAVEAVAESGAPIRRVELSARRRTGSAVPATKRASTAARGRAEGMVSVCDTGPGISPAVVDRMFNPFFTTRAAGTGLGLAIVHRIMDAHGGRVEAGNNPGGASRGGVGACGRKPVRPNESGIGRGAGHGGPGGGCGATFSLVFPEASGRGRRPAGMPALEQDR